MSTWASRSRAMSSCGKRAQISSSSSVAREVWVRAISRPSKTGSARLLSFWRSISTIESPVSASARARQSPLGPAPMMAISQFMRSVSPEVKGLQSERACGIEYCAGSVCGLRRLRSGVAAGRRSEGRDDAAQGSHCLFATRVPRMTVVQAGAVAVMSVGREYRTWRQADALGQGVLE